MSKKIILSIIFAIMLICISLTVNANTLTKNDIDYNTNVSYSNISKQIINIDLTLTNNTNKTKPTVLTATNIPSGITLDKKTQVIVLEANEKRTIPLQINYNNNDANKIEYTLSYSNKKIIIPISLARDQMPILQTNRLTAFFSLAENNSKTIFIVLDVLLFIAAVVLFTMFIGRLGNYIVKK